MGPRSSAYKSRRCRRRLVVPGTKSSRTWQRSTWNYCWFVSVSTRRHHAPPTQDIFMSKQNEKSGFRTAVEDTKRLERLASLQSRTAATVSLCPNLPFFYFWILSASPVALMTSSVALCQCRSSSAARSDEAEASSGLRCYCHYCCCRRPRTLCAALQCSASWRRGSNSHKGEMP